ncbi:pro-sigmaK processing inhibitor BofA family protein [Peribacillus sp. SCS-26]|uniref:pro-sigmaK processing inhibitor BofA family protein n=1 Tax=Paraperibacillus marinus TaxID=3115295 RepID=UPI0039060484
MEPIAFIAVIGSLIVLLLLVGTPLKPLRWAGQGAIRLVIGALFLFFLNAMGNAIGLHVPINLATSSIAGFLGIPGVAAMAALQYWIL